MIHAQMAVYFAERMLSNAVSDRWQRGYECLRLDIPSRWRYVVNKAAQPFYPSAAHDKFFSICTAFGGYTEFGIAPMPE